MFRFIPTIALASLGNPNSVFATSPPLPACDEAKGCGECLSNPDCTWWNDIKYCEDVRDVCIHIRLDTFDSCDSQKLTIGYHICFTSSTGMRYERMWSHRLP